MKIIFSKRCLEFKQPNHPESPERVRRCYEHLLERNFEFVEPAVCRDEDILLVHSKKLLEEVRSGDFSDPDTPNLNNIFQYAKLSVGAAILASEIALKEGLCFSLMRPPGHHASKESLGGFCYFNNIAIAVEKLRNKGRRVAIIDFDCHHGNGTQDIFLGEEGIIYLSLHCSPLYPGTGLKSEKNCYNFPMPADTDEAAYLSVLREGLNFIEKFNPQVLAISAGFDTYRRDPLAGLSLDKESFRKIGQLIAEFKLPTFAILEGGYSHDLGQCVYEFITGLAP